MQNKINLRLISHCSDIFISKFEQFFYASYVPRFELQQAFHCRENGKL